MSVASSVDRRKMAASEPLPPPVAQKRKRESGSVSSTAAATTAVEELKSSTQPSSSADKLQADDHPMDDEDESSSDTEPEDESPKEPSSTETTEKTQSAAPSLAAQMMMASLTTLKTKSTAQAEKAQQQESETAAERKRQEDLEQAKQTAAQQRYVPTDPIEIKTTQSYEVNKAIQPPQAAASSKNSSYSNNNKRRMTMVREIQRPPEIVAARYELPVTGMEFEIMDAIRNHDVTILCAETGSGKSTQVVQFLYEAGLSQQRSSRRCVVVAAIDDWSDATPSRRRGLDGQARVLRNGTGQWTNDPSQQSGGLPNTLRNGRIGLPNAHQVHDGRHFAAGDSARFAAAPVFLHRSGRSARAQPQHGRFDWIDQCGPAVAPGSGRGTAAPPRGHYERDAPRRGFYRQSPLVFRCGGCY